MDEEIFCTLHHSSPLFTFYDFGKGINAEPLSCQQPKKVKGG